MGPWGYKQPKLIIPYFPQEDEEGEVNYKIETNDLKLVSNYTGFNFIQVQELEIDEFLYLLREAFIHSKMQTKDGREYLRNAYILTKCNPDRERLRDKFGGGKRG